MAYLEVKSSGKVNGRLVIQGSKNAALPIISAALLCRGKTIIRNVPRIYDVSVMLELVKGCGCSVVRNGNTVIIDAENVNSRSIPKQLMKSMRSSIILLAPVLYRCQNAEFTQPGGCSIGSRPIDIHLYVLQKMGAVIETEGERITAKSEGFTGGDIMLRFPSVGATEQAVLAAVCAAGITRICNAAKEPEIVELCRMLINMGAVIAGEGTDEIVIFGVKALQESVFTVDGDRIAAATYMSAVAACGGSAVISGIRTKYLQGVTEVYSAIGCDIECSENEIYIRRNKTLRSPGYIKTAPYPGFPTDVQSMFLVLMTMADSKSVVEEAVFNGRFRTAYLLKKMRADIIIEDNRAIISPCGLIGCDVEAPDLRGGAALTIAGLIAEGTTRIYGYEHIIRGYEDMPGDLKKLGISNICLREDDTGG